MSETHTEEVNTGIYVKIFGALAVLTVVTVAVSYLNVGMGLAIAIALLIAIVKGSLVAGFFMHLLHEKPIIYWLLICTVIFFIAVMVLPMLSGGLTGAEPGGWS